ncbi:MAG: CheR family methyltransferase [Pirellulaceae bacterium]
MAFTYFFRDAQTLEVLIEQALPTLAGQAFIRIWDAGCAHGPEPYTLAMLLRERMSDFVFRNVRIQATDVDPQFGLQVAAGIYTDQETQRIPAPFLERYFQPASEPGRVQVVNEIRAKVSFAPHDLLSLQPLRDDFSLIICKNVLLHIEEPQRINVLRMFHRALRSGGMLVTEHTQKLPDALAPFFQQVAPYAQVHRKVEPAYGKHQGEENCPHCHRTRYVDRSVDGPERQRLDSRLARR